MVFTHDTEAALLSAVALVNSASEPDTLTTRAELAAFLDEQEFTGTRRGDDAPSWRRSGRCDPGCARS